MATSSSDGSCTAPADFQLSSELEDVSNRLSVNLLKCPLCHNSSRIVYCRQCIQNGDFIYSTTVYTERFADKQLRLLRLKAARAQLEEKCVKALDKHKQRDKLICDINTCKERVRLLQSLVNETRQSINRGNQRLNVLKDVNSQLALRLPRHEERVEKLHQYVTGLRARQEKQKEAVDRKRQQLKKVIRTAAKQLIQYIFPLSKVQPNRSLCSSEEDASSDVVTCALADASGTSYVRGRWINDTENALEVQHRIVAPTLPGTGDYSAYSLWVAANKDGVPGANKETAMHNPAYNISAALTYATQLVNIIAYYVNIRLPYQLAYRIGPMEVDPNIVAQLHSQLVPDLENSDDSASDEEEDTFNWDWEAVPNVACPEMAVPIPGAMVSQQSSSMQVNQSVAGGLVTSAAAGIASIWRGWTTNK
ncbi:Beclin 1-associated autophagy-related key regulator [Habropoda laboriosa]|uniref:Beclin 1-associated autophagy-related key regulator n=1 Tax=Habropoda laboriosa TaxID=597456 RepID=A0A0L7R4F8_9HYME|nr:Beclin 1-associated autophagy-related key regulator [Habropoda laboriosa]